MFFDSSSPELNPQSEDSTEKNNNNIESTTIPPYHSQRSHSSPSVTYESFNDDHSDPQSVIENLSDEETSSNLRTVNIPSPSNHSEQDDSVESLNSSSNSSLPSKQHRIDHRRNKSEPVKSLSNEDLLDSSLSNNACDENHRKSSIKILSNPDEKIPLSSSLSTSRKKKAWYNVSEQTSFLFLSSS